MARRVLAAIGAVAIVLVAFVVRSLLDDSGDPSGPRGDDEVVLACSPELADACRQIPGVRVRSEPAATTSAAIVAGDAEDIDGWVTTDVWYELTAARAGRALGSAERVATSPVVLAVVPARLEALERHCTGKPLWYCVGDDAGRQWTDLGGEAGWGPLQIGMPSADSAVGLSVLAAGTIGYFDGTDFAANDFDPDFDSWLSRLTDASAAGDSDPMGTMLRQAGRYSAAGTTLAPVTTSAREVAHLEPAPPVSATVVLVDLPGRTPLPSAQGLRDVLVARSWQAADGEPEPLLIPGVAGALHGRWRQATR